MEFLVDNFWDVIAAAGFLLIVLGLSLIHFPAALIVCGLGLLSVGLCFSYLSPFLRGDR